DSLYAGIVLLGVIGAIIGICKHGYDRGAWILMYVFVAVMGGAVGVVLSLLGILVWTALQGQPAPRLNTFATVQMIGFGLGAAVGWWGRYLMGARRPGEKSSFIDLALDMMTRLLRVLGTLMPMIGGVLGLIVLWFFLDFDWSAFRS